MLPKEFDQNLVVKTISAHVSKEVDIRSGTLRIELPKHMINPQKQSIPSSTPENEAVEKLPNTLPMTSNHDVQTTPISVLSSNEMTTGTLPYFT